MTLFDEVTETHKRDHGKAVAAATHSTVLGWLREAMVARWRDLKAKGVRDYVTADDARVLLEIAIDNGRFERPGSMNFMGHLFQGQDWEFTGYRIKSTTPGSHANELKCWRYIGS